MFKIKIGDTVQEIKNKYVLKQLRQFKGNFELGMQISIAAGRQNRPYLLRVIKNIPEVIVILEKVY